MDREKNNGTENVTYSANDWQQIAGELHNGTNPAGRLRYPAHMRPFAEHVYNKARSVHRRPEDQRSADGRFTETLTPADATHVREAGNLRGATQLPNDAA